MNDRDKLKFTLEKMSKAATDLLTTDAEKVDLSWISAFCTALETTLEAIE